MLNFKSLYHLVNFPDYSVQLDFNLGGFTCLNWERRYFFEVNFFIHNSETSKVRAILDEIFGREGILIEDYNFWSQTGEKSGFDLVFYSYPDDGEVDPLEATVQALEKVYANSDIPQYVKSTNYKKCSEGHPSQGAFETLRFAVREAYLMSKDEQYMSEIKYKESLYKFNASHGTPAHFLSLTEKEQDQLLEDCGQYTMWIKIGKPPKMATPEQRKSIFNSYVEEAKLLVYNAEKRSSKIA